MALARIPQNRSINRDISSTASESHFLGTANINSTYWLVEPSSTTSYDKQRLMADKLLLDKTIAICERYGFKFTTFSTIQRKFITHFRCYHCGLQPLYEISLLHAKRARCRKCGQLTGFRSKGKYGKLRKQIALELAKENEKYD